VSQSVEALAITMVQPPFDTSLMSLVSLTPLLTPRLLAASLTAIYLTAITVRADEKASSACLTEALS
jgi:hypothetical protein